MTDRALSAEPEAQIRTLICEKRPEQLKMQFALYTRGAVMPLIERGRWWQQTHGNPFDHDLATLWERVLGRQRCLGDGGGFAQIG